MAEFGDVFAADIYRCEATRNRRHQYDAAGCRAGISAVVQTTHHLLVFDTGAKFSEAKRYGAERAVALFALARRCQDRQLNHQSRR